MKKKFKRVVWGFKYPDGTILTGHNGKPITNNTRKETQKQCNNTPENELLKPKPVRLVIREE